MTLTKETRQSTAHWLTLGLFALAMAYGWHLNKKIAENYKWRESATPIIDRLDTATVVARADDGLILRWSAGATRLFGYSEGDVFGRTIDILLPASMREQHKEFMTRPTADGVKRIRCWALKKDGEIFEALVAIRWAGEGKQRFVHAQIDLPDKIEELPTVGVEALSPDERERIK